MRFELGWLKRWEMADWHRVHKIGGLWKGAIVVRSGGDSELGCVWAGYFSIAVLHPLLLTRVCAVLLFWTSWSMGSSPH